MKFPFFSRDEDNVFDRQMAQTADLLNMWRPLTSYLRGNMDGVVLRPFTVQLQQRFDFNRGAMGLHLGLFYAPEQDASAACLIGERRFVSAQKPRFSLSFNKAAPATHLIDAGDGRQILAADDMVEAKDHLRRWARGQIRGFQAAHSP